MTKQEAIENHRKMWNWIADETLKQGRIVRKREYLDRFYNDEYNTEYIIGDCFCCQYDYEQSMNQIINVKNRNCKYCPINFGEGNIETSCINGDDSPYRKWLIAFKRQHLIEEAAKYAREIAELPEREDVK